MNAFWNHLDPKLRATLLSGIVAFLVAKFAVDLDPDTSALITLLIAAFSGYTAENEGSHLRAQDDLDGAMLQPPAELDPSAEDPNYDPTLDKPAAFKTETKNSP